MKSLALLLCSLFAMPVFGADLEALAKVRTVYVLQMGRGFDQYLAQQIITQNLFQVVTDPAKADAVFTDHLGEEFEKRLGELYPKAKPVPSAEAASEPARASEAAKTDDGTSHVASTDKPADKDIDAGATKSAGSPAGTKNPKAGMYEDRQVPVSTFTRGKGNFFIVDPRGRVVLWSGYAYAKNTSPDDLSKVAAGLVKQVEKALMPSGK